MLSSLVNVKHPSHKVSRRSLAKRAKKYTGTKMCDGRAKLLFWLLNLLCFYVLLAIETSDGKVPVLVGKRGSRRHSTIRVSEDVVVAETKY